MLELNHIPEVLRRVKKEYIQNAYGVKEWDDPTDFLTKYAIKSGKLLKKAEPDLNTVAKKILNDFQRGKLPYFNPPPFDTPAPEKKSENKVETVEAVEEEEEEEENANNFNNIPKQKFKKKSEFRKNSILKIAN